MPDEEIEKLAERLRNMVCSLKISKETRLLSWKEAPKSQRELFVGVATNLLANFIPRSEHERIVKFWKEKYAEFT